MNLRDFAYSFKINPYSGLSFQLNSTCSMVWATVPSFEFAFTNLKSLVFIPLVKHGIGRLILSNGLIQLPLKSLKLPCWLK